MTFWELVFLIAMFLVIGWQIKKEKDKAEQAAYGKMVGVEEEEEMELSMLSETGVTKRK